MKDANNSRGFSLVEVVVVMGVFLIIMMISTYAFQNIVKRGSLQGKIAESGITGIVGLEIMRTDLGHAGYGLPWSFQITPNPVYKEIDDDNLPTANVVATATFNGFRDVPPSTPRAIVSGAGASGTANDGIDYLVIKGSIVGTSPTARRWNFVNYSGLNYSYLRVKGDPSTDLANNDQVINVLSTFTTTGDATKQLLMKAANDYKYIYSNTPPAVPIIGTANAAFQPTNATQTVIAYGINTGAFRMPYNRVDYYVDKSAAKPASCAPGTGVLHKAVADQAGGFSKYPLLDCVGDMQVIYDLDKADGTVTYSDALIDPDPPNAALDSAGIRNKLKKVRIYLLTHEGKKDTNFSYPPIDATNAICVAPMVGSTCSNNGKLWTQANMASTFGAGWKNYRWKVISFAVNLKNLQ